MKSTGVLESALAYLFIKINLPISWLSLLCLLHDIWVDDTLAQLDRDSVSVYVVSAFLGKGPFLILYFFACNFPNRLTSDSTILSTWPICQLEDGDGVYIELDTLVTVVCSWPERDAMGVPSLGGWKKVLYLSMFLTRSFISFGHSKTSLKRFLFYWCLFRVVRAILNLWQLLSNFCWILSVVSAISHFHVRSIVVSGR